MPPPSSANVNRPQNFSEWYKTQSAKIKDAAVNIRRAFILVWHAHPASSLGMMACTLIGAGLPVAQAWVGKLIVDAVVTAIRSGGSAETGINSILQLFLMEFILVVIKAANSQARNFAEHILHARINITINSTIIRKALELDLAHFENAEFYDKLQNARREADWRSLQIVNGGFFLIQN
ncbi:MAG: ABC transporter ATP-binding protein, partial [Chloroflexi bacterium]|nr:ABC transporter ATP-binding protein [Chloroflexota bacterium]